MESDDQSLPHLLDTNQQAGPDALRAIVAQASHRRLRTAGVLASAALLVGGGVGGAIGYAASNHSNRSVQTASAPQANSVGAGTATSGAGGAGSAVSGSFSTGTGRLTYEFTRTANGVDIRGYEVASPDLLPAINGCTGGELGPRFEAEVSTAKAVGIASGGFASTASTTAAVKSTSTQVIGLAEGDPVAVVVAATPTSVTSVKVTFAGGATDQMAPVKGWVALAGPAATTTSKGVTQVKPDIGTLAAYNSAGAQVAHQSVALGATSTPTPIAPQPALCGVCPGPLRAPASVPPGVVNPGGPMIQSPPSRSSSASGPVACPAQQTHNKTGSVSGGSAAPG